MKTAFIFLILIPVFTIAQQSFNSAGKYGFKLNDKEVIAPQYDYAADFSGGLACVKKDGKWGYINPKNEWVSSIYDRVQPLMNGFGRVLLNGRLGLIDSTGKATLKPEYSEIEFRRNYLIITKESGVGLISKTMSIPCNYANVWQQKGGYAFATRIDEKYDIYDESGLVLSAQENYFSSYRTRSGLVIATKKGKYGIFNIETKEWQLKPKYPKIGTIRVVDYADGGEKPSHLVYAVFKKVNEKETDHSSEKKVIDSDITLLKTTSLEKIIDGVTGYQATSTYSGGRIYKCELYLKNQQEPVLIKTLLNN